jgi:ABC-2 type transport system permease protein
MTFATGSVPWLIRHELRLYWRTSKSVSSITFLVIGQVLLHLIALGIALATQAAGGRPIPQGPVLLFITIGMGFSLLIMTSRALAAAIQALYTRGDLDLLLSSPIAPNAIVAVRAAAIALGVTFEIAMLLWPFANVFVLFGRFEWFKAYLLLPSLGMLATSLALVLMIALFRLLGPRRTRVFVQVAAAVIGMSFVLLFQLPNAMRGGGPAARRGNPFRDLAGNVDGPQWIPAQLVQQGFIPTILLLIACAAILVFTVRAVGHRFVDASTLVASVSKGGPVRARSSTLRLRTGLRRVLILKELRLIARDPMLLTHLLGQLVFLLPLGLALWRGTAQSATPWAWLTILFLVGSTASALAWLTVSAEDAPDLLASSPVPTRALVRAKVEAALLPVTPLLLIPVIALWRTHLAFSLWLAVCAAGAGISCALLQIRNPVTRKREDFKTRHKGRGLSGLIEILVIGLWAGLCAGATFA